MRLLLISHHSNTDGGASRFLWDQAVSFKQAGHEVMVLNRSSGPLTTGLARDGIENHIVPYPVNLSAGLSLPGAARRWLQNQLSCRRLAGLFHRWRPTHIYTNTSVVWLGSYLGRRFDLPHLWHIHEFGDRDFGLQPDFGRPYFISLLRHSTHLVFNSRAVRDHYPELADHPGSHVVYNGIFQEAEAPGMREAADRSQRNPQQFLMVGALRESKGQHLAIQAMSKVRESHSGATLVLVGEGEAEYISHCRQLVEKLGLGSSVVFTGYLNDPGAMFRESHAFLMCSAFEAFGRVTAEAMAAGCIIIGNNSGGTAELVTEGVTGWLFDGSVDSLAAKMTESLTHTRDESHIRKQAQEFVFKNLSREEISRRLESILE